MSAINVHPRVTKRHPELAPRDVVDAFKSMLRYKQRPDGAWAAVGVDGNNRLVELVYLYDEEDDSFLVYHAMTPPSRKTLLELEMERR